VDLLAGWAQGNDFLERGEEVLNGVARGSLAMNPTGGRIKCCIQGEGSVPLVFESVEFDVAWRKWKHWIEAIQCLKGRR
jgi:hypothetical protein